MLSLLCVIFILITSNKPKISSLDTTDSDYTSYPSDTDSSSCPVPSPVMQRVTDLQQILTWPVYCSAEQILSSNQDSYQVFALPPSPGDTIFTPGDRTVTPTATSWERVATPWERIATTPEKEDESDDV